jgi:hypothetical protein
MVVIEASRWVSPLPTLRNAIPLFSPSFLSLFGEMETGEARFWYSNLTISFDFKSFDLKTKKDIKFHKASDFVDIMNIHGLLPQPESSFGSF